MAQGCVSGSWRLASGVVTHDLPRGSVMLAGAAWFIVVLCHPLTCVNLALWSASLIGVERQLWNLWAIEGEHIKIALLTLLSYLDASVRSLVRIAGKYQVQMNVTKVTLDSVIVLA
jgi:hypothetical protein